MEDGQREGSVHKAEYGEEVGRHEEDWALGKRINCKGFDFYFRVCIV